MKPDAMIAAGAATAGLAVLLGAFGAHALHDLLLERGELATYETAVRYQMYHGLALLLCGLLAERGRRTTAAAWCFLLGTAVFSGTLYGLSLVGPRWLGAITPIGGTLMIAGWVLLALGARRRPSA